MEINWAQIQTAVGNASHIPENIKLLASDDEKIRYNAYWKIDNYAILQGDLHEAAYYIIDPLIALLHETKHKTEVIDLLTEIALGYAINDNFITIERTKTPLLNACRNKLLQHVKFLVALQKNTANKNEQMMINDLIEILSSY